MTRQLAPGVFVFRSDAFAMNSGVIVGPDPRGALLVDPAFFPSDLDRIDEFLARTSTEPGWIVLTHSDWDHTVGVARWPHAALVASSELPVRAARDAGRNADALARLDQKLYIERDGPLSLPQPATLVGSPCNLVWEGRAVDLLPAGGHTPDGLMLLLKKERVLFAGDHLSDREIPFVGDSIAAYRDTLAHVRSLTLRGEIEMLVPGHGEICAREEIIERIEEDADYLVRLDGWVRETRRTVDTIEGLIERCDEVVYRKGAGNPDIEAEHRANVAGLARALGMA